MPINIEKVKAALDDFENENFVDSKEKITKEIRKAVSDRLKDKLGIKTTGLEEPEVEVDAGEDNGDKEVDGDDNDKEDDDKEE